MFFLDTCDNWSTQIHFFEIAQITQPLSPLRTSPYEKILKTTEFSNKRFSKKNCERTAQNNFNFPPQLHY